MIASVCDDDNKNGWIIVHVYVLMFLLCSEIDFDMEKFVGDNIPILVVGTKQVQKSVTMYVHVLLLCDNCNYVMVLMKNIIVIVVKV